MRGAEVYVNDSFNYRIQVFDLQGNFLCSWVSRGSGDGEFECPLGICVRDCVDGKVEVYVCETASNHRIQVFDHHCKATFFASGAVEVVVMGSFSFYGPCMCTLVLMVRR